MALTNDKKYLFSGDTNGLVVVWYVPTFVTLCVIQMKPQMPIDQLLVSSDSSFLVIMDNDG